MLKNQKKHDKFKKQKAAQKAASQPDGAKKGMNPRKRRNIIIASVVGAVVAIALVIAALFATGVLAPPGTAARYAGASYITEDEVTEYIETFREQSGYEDDDTWKAYLQEAGLTPETLRETTIYQLILDNLVEGLCDEYDIQVSEEELDTVIDNLKTAFALGDEEKWQEVLDGYGITEEQTRANYEKQLRQDALMEKLVDEPTPTDDEVISYMTYVGQNISDPTVKHTYCFKKLGLDEGGSLEKINEVMDIHDDLVAKGVSKENFVSIVQLYSDDDELLETNGANGWNVDTDGYSTKYNEELVNLGLNDVSEVFAEDDGYAFIWVSNTYTLPTTDEEAAEITKDGVPEELWEYFSDSAAAQLWQTAINEYQNELVNASNPQIYAMPSNVSYNVDMD